MRVSGFFRFSAVLGMSVAALSGAAHAQAQSYPTKPIRIIAPFVAGGTVDAVSRALSVQLSEDLGQQVVIENRGGASGNIGADLVAKSPADGYTLLLTASTIIANPLVMKEKPAFNLSTDFTPVGIVASTPLVFVIKKESPISSVSEFIAAAKANPAQFNFGVGGYGSGGHLAMESFNVRTGTQIPMIIYKGSAPALTDIVGGQISAIMDPVLTTLPFVEAGRLKAIAVTGNRRNALLPDVPTLAEVGVKDMDFVSWYGLWAPANLPESTARRLESALTKALANPGFKSWLAKQGMDAGTLTGDKFKAFVDAERVKYTTAVNAARIEAK